MIKNILDLQTGHPKQEGARCSSEMSLNSKCGSPDRSHMVEMILVPVPAPRLV